MPNDPAAAAIGAYVQVYADTSHFWEKYHDQQVAYRDGADQVAAAAAGLQKGALSRIANAQPRPPRQGDRRAEWVTQTTDLLLAMWRSGHLGPMTDGS